MKRVRVLFGLVFLFVCPFVGQADPDDNRYIEFEHRITGDALSAVLPFQNGMLLLYTFEDDSSVYLLSVDEKLYYIDERSPDNGRRWANIALTHRAFIDDSHTHGSLIEVVHLDDQKIRLDTHSQVPFFLTHLEDGSSSLLVGKFLEYNMRFEDVSDDEFSRGGFGVFEFTKERGKNYRIS